MLTLLCITELSTWAVGLVMENHWTSFWNTTTCKQHCIFSTSVHFHTFRILKLALKSIGGSTSTKHIKELSRSALFHRCFFSNMLPQLFSQVVVYIPNCSRFMPSGTRNGCWLQSILISIQNSTFTANITTEFDLTSSLQHP